MTKFTNFRTFMKIRKVMNTAKAPARYIAILIPIVLINILLFTNTLTAQSNPSQFPNLTLDNKVVKMGLYLPDPEKGSYRATRFDWSGIIHSLQYQGHEFFGYWKKTHDPTIHEDLSGPAEAWIAPGLGYEEAKPGEGFLRIGVGLIEKEKEEKYNSFKTYRILDHGRWKVRHGKDWVTFTHKASSPLGYGYVYTKTIRLTKDQPGFTIAHELKNTGRKKIQTDQFNHNFFILDGEETGPNLEVEFPYPISTEQDLKGLVSLDQHKLRFLKQFEATSVFMTLKGYNNSPEHHAFSVSNKRSGAGVTVKLDQPLHQMNFWACQTTFCPENFIYIDLEPGRSFEWQADYSLFVD